MSAPVDSPTSSVPHPVHSSAQAARVNPENAKGSSSKTAKKEKAGTPADPSKPSLEVSTADPLRTLPLEPSFK